MYYCYASTAKMIHFEFDWRAMLALGEARAKPNTDTGMTGRVAIEESSLQF